MIFTRPTALPIVEFQGADQGYATQRVTSPYGPRGNGFHAGLDIGNARLGDDLIAVAPGKVIYAGTAPIPWTYPKPSDAWWNALPEGPQAGQRGGLYGPPSKWVGTTWAGRIEVIDHGEGYWSSYSHEQTISVSVGQQVVRGQRIGTIGDSGSAYRQGHVHFGIRFAGAYDNDHDGWIDPWPLIRASAGLATLPDTSTEDPMPTLTKRITGQLLRVPAATDFRKAPSFGTAPYYRAATPMSVQPIGTVDGDAYKVSATANSTAWHVYVTSDLEYGYLPAVIGELVAIDQPTDCGPQVQAATDPLRARIDRMQKLTAAHNATIQNA